MIFNLYKFDLKQIIKLRLIEYSFLVSKFYKLVDIRNIDSDFTFSNNHKLNGFNSNLRK